MNDNTPKTRRMRSAAQSPAHRAVDLTQPAPESARTGEQQPRLPHERDEGLGMAAPQPDKRIKQGLADVARGVQDTSRAPEADRAYRQTKKR